jgi:hypothetical protein
MKFKQFSTMRVRGHLNLRFKSITQSLPQINHNVIDDSKYSKYLCITVENFQIQSLKKINSEDKMNKIVWKTTKEAQCNGCLK